MQQFTITIRDNVYPYNIYHLDTSLKWTDGFNDSCIFSFSDYNYIKDRLLENNKQANYEFDIVDLDTNEVIYSSDYKPQFYYSNLVNGYQINKRAVNNLLNNYTIEQLIQVDNYNELGLVEYVADNNYYIKNNHIYKIEG